MPPPLPILSAAVQVTRLAGSVGADIRSVVTEDDKLTGKIKNGLVALMKELELLEGSVAGSSDRYLGPAHETKIVQLQDLLFDVEVFVQRLWVPGKCGYLLLCFGKDPRQVDLDRILHFRERIKAIREFKPDEGGRDAEPRVSSATCACTPEAELVGIAEPKAEILELISPGAGGLELRVISLVGRRGVGKTTLARALYDQCRASRDYDCVAWVGASDCIDANTLLDRILQVVRAETRVVDGDIYSILDDKRYIIVIDDLQGGYLWQYINKVFPENFMCNRIIVTTSVKSVASSCRGHLYNINALSSSDSRKLFWDRVQIYQSRALVDALETTLDKCEGLPLALISLANHLLEQGKVILKVRDCRQEGLSLGRHLAGPDATRCFQEIRRSLAHCYGDLPDHVHRMCLLSLTMFPRGHMIKMKSLVRELIAGGLIVGDDVRLDKENIACACLEELINRNLIEPIIVCTDYKFKRCQVDGIMLEFFIHKSAYQNFATLIHDDVCLPKFRSSNRVRRLSIHGGTEQSRRLAEKIILSDTRWLRISNTTVFVDLKACESLQVLDLECCTGIDGRVMKEICQLQLLKYLGLRGSDVSMIPKQIKKLNSLQTLDIRETRVTQLPIEVLILPQLACVLGQFEPPNSSKKARATLEHLHTLAGVVISKDWQAFNQLMLQAGKRLKKIKIWCRTPPPCQSSSFEDRLQERFTGTTALDSLTIDSSNLCKEFVGFLKPPCGIRSVKLRGALDCLPEPAMLRELGSLQELYLVSTGLSCDALSVLQVLPCLVYLKLSERDGFMGGGSFVSQSYGFESLQRLCVEAPKLPQVLIEPGAMKCLASLDLLCPEYSPMPILPFPFVMTDAEKIECWLGFIGISHLVSLKELMLHVGIDDIKMQRWKEISMLHKNKPCVKRQSN